MMTFLLDLLRKPLFSIVLCVVAGAVLIAVPWFAGIRHERGAWKAKEAQWGHARAALEFEVAAAKGTVLQLEGAITRAAQANAQQQRAHMAQIRRAKVHATRREKTLQRDIAHAHRAVDGLRNEITASLNRLSADTTTATARDGAGRAALNALGECSQRYRAVAEEADACGLDRQTLIESWPK